MSAPSSLVPVVEGATGPIRRPPPASATRAEMERGRRHRRRRRTVVLGTLWLALVALVVVRALLGPYPVSFLDAVRILSGEDVPGASFVLLESTLPRAVMAVLAGAALGAAGASFQSMLRNPLASPDVLGLTLGASAGAVVAVVVLDRTGVPVTLAALTGSLLVATALLSQAGRGGGATSRMVLVGVALAAMLGALVHWVLLYADIHNAQQAMLWLTGSLNTVTWGDIARLTVLDALVLPVLVLLGPRVGLLSLGDDVAGGLGLGVAGTRRAVTLAVVVLVAGATALVGPIAFVGLLSGPIARALLPGRPAPGAAALVGAVTVLAADHVAATLVDGTPLPVGVVTGVLGAPVLLWLLHTSSRTREIP